MKTLLTTLAFIAFSGAAQAASITIDESNAPGGDYADALGASGNQLGAAADGTTSVTLIGDLRCNSVTNCSGGLNDPFDAFYFDVAADTEVTRMRISVFPSLPSTLLEFTALLIDTSDGSSVFNTTFAASDSATNVDLIGTGDAPIGPGNYNFALSFSSLGSDVQGTVPYLLRSTIASTAVAPVPVPATLPLLLAGLGGFAFLGRRRKQDA